jgi:hypothetical protein
MDKKKLVGYVTGLVCLLIFALLSYLAIISVSNGSTATIIGIFAALFGGLGFGSLWKPYTIGAVASQFLKNLSKGSQESSDSHDKQIQKKSNGSVQVMAHDQSNVSITVHSGKKKNTQNLPENTKSLQDEKKEILRKEKIVVDASNGYDYEFDLIRGDHVKAEIQSTSPIDIFFADEVNDDKWNRAVAFEYVDSNESVLETTIDYVAPKKGKWYVIIENNGEKPAIIKIQFYQEKSRSGFILGPFGEPQ